MQVLNQTGGRSFFLPEETQPLDPCWGMHLHYDVANPLEETLLNIQSSEKPPEPL